MGYIVDHHVVLDGVRTETVGSTHFDAACPLRRKRAYCRPCIARLALFKTKRQNMGVMGDHKHFPQGNNRLAEMHPIGDDLLAGIKRLSSLRIEGIK